MSESKILEEDQTKQETPPNSYNMNNYNIVQMVKTSFRYKGKKKYTTDDMRREYFNIVVAKKLESQEWIDYYKSVLEIE